MSNRNPPHSDHIKGAPEAAVPPPDLLRGRYRLVSEIGRGGQGIVFRALDDTTGTEVAVKLFAGDGRGAAPLLARFARECQTLARMDHPNVVRILATGQDSAGVPFLVMEFVEGPTLEEYFASRRDGAGYLDEVRRIFRTLALALDAVHKEGIVHRDLKPSNVRIDPRGEAHLLDFGLAAGVAPQDPAAAALSASGKVLGSLPWNSPEALERSATSVDGRADLYSLAVMLYHELAGRFPYRVTGPPQEAIASIVASRPAPLTLRKKNLRATVGLSPVLVKALAKDPAQRFQTGREFADALEIAARHVATPRLAMTIVRRHRWGLVLSLTAVLVLVITCLHFLMAPPKPAFTDSMGIEFARIPAGEFVMGSPEGEAGREDDELPHRVRITKPFLMSISEVTVEQYRRVTGQPSTAPEPRDAGIPISGVSWRDADMFCRLLSETTGRSYRLPTEAEWEYACRAGSQGPFGGGELQTTGWYLGNTPTTGMPGVKMKLPNRWGLYDMHGGVAEWCSDVYAPYSPGDVDGPQHLSPGSVHVVRGGSIKSPPDKCRAAARSLAPADWRGGPSGIRLVLDIPP